MTRMTAIGCACVVLLGLSSVSAGASGGSVPKSVVEAQAAKVLAAETGQKPPKVTCPGDLQGTLGASMRCTLTPAGSRLVYPVKVTVNSVSNGTAHFSVQVGQAIGVANQTTFCHDNALLDRATIAAKTPAQLVPILVANEKTIQEFQATAPPKIVISAGTLAHAASVAIRSRNAAAFATAPLMQAESAVNAFCGQNPDGSAVGSPSTTAG
jgi:hypothetical protein